MELKIITGVKNLGKTTKLIDTFDLYKSAAGFAIPKIYENGNHVGYEIMDLESKERRKYAFFKNKHASDNDFSFSFGPFVFSQDAFIFASNIMNRAIEKNKSTFFFDEIGKIELMGNGFDKIFKIGLESFPRIVVVFKLDYLDAIIAKYELPNEKIDIIFK